MGVNWVKCRAAVAMGLAASLVASMLVATPASAEPVVMDPKASCVDSVPDAVAARKAAAACGRRVEALSARTEYAQTFINPDGTATMVKSIVPQRVRQGAGWVPVDVRLRRTAAGIVPGATVQPMVFSAGGSRAPLARLTDHGRDIALTWKGSLPVPELIGNVALYRDVLPGVDLRVTAGVLGFTHVLIVNSRQAAANPKLNSLRFGLSTKDLTVTAAAGGGLVARDSKGASVFTSAAPMMWDSTPHLDEAPAAKGARGVAPSAARTEPSRPAVAGGPREAIMPVRVEGSDVVLSPDRKLLDDPRVRYPVFIDPPWSRSVDAGWTSVWSKYPDSNFGWLNPSAVSNPQNGNMGSGRVRDCDGCSDYIIRSLFQFNVDELRGVAIVSAQFTIDQYWSWTCSPASDARLSLTGAISSATTWNTQPYFYPEYTTTSPANHRSDGAFGCNGVGPVEFNAQPMVAYTSALNLSTVTLGLHAVNEGTVNQWKKFMQDSARLSVTYNRPPNVPTNRLSDGLPCATGPARPYVLRTNPVLSVYQSDPDTEQPSIVTDFHYWVLGAQRDEVHKLQVGAANPGTNSAQIPPGNLVDGGTYVWQTRSHDGSLIGDWSGTCEFTVDATPPNPPQSVTATPYLSDASPHGGVGIEGTFTITAPATKPQEVVSYAWTFDGATAPSASMPKVPANSANAYQGELKYRPTRDGVHHLRVWSIDQSGRASSSYVEYTFTVRAGSGPAAQWLFDEASGAALDATFHGNTATLAAGAARTSGRGGGLDNALAVNGTSTAYASTSGPVQTPNPDSTATPPAMLSVRTDTSFTVTARVRLAATGGQYKAAVAADGTNVSAFVLGYSGSDNRWRFSMARADTTSPGVDQVLSGSAPTAGVWTHLAGTFDAADKTMRLYVNGVLEATTTTLVGGFNATGGITIGRARWNTASTDFFNNAIDDVRIYNFLESPANLAALAAPLAPVVSFPNGATAPPGGTINVLFDAGGDANVTSFKYGSTSTSLNQTVAPGTPGGTATVSVSVGSTSGAANLYVVSSTSAALLSPPWTATYTVKAPRRLVGTVVDVNGDPMVGALVTATPGGLQATTGSTGAFAFTGLAAGSYTLVATLGGPCGLIGSVTESIGDDEVQTTILVFPVTDESGNTCQEQVTAFVPANDAVLALTGDNAVTQVSLPFAFPFYGHAYYTAWIDTNGVLSFTDPGGSHPYTGGPGLPDSATPNATVAAFWDDLVVDGSSSVRTATVGSGAAQTFVIEWRNVFRQGNSSQRVTFEAILARDGTVTTNYSDLDNAAERGAGATVGIEAPSGSDALRYSMAEPVLQSGHAVVFDQPGAGSPIVRYDLTGTLTDASGTPVIGATVTVNPKGLSTTTGAGGTWAFPGLVADSYTVSSSVGGRCAARVNAVVDLAADTVRNLQLAPDYGYLGYACSTGASGYVAATNVLALTGDDDQTQVTAPFPVTLHGRTYTSGWVSTNGLVSFGTEAGSGTGVNQPLPTADAPNAVVAPFWDDLVVDGSATVRTDLVGTAPNRGWVVEWRNVLIKGGTDRVTVEAILGENNQIGFHYGALSTDSQRGSGATIGLEDATGTLAASYSHNEASLTSNGSVVFTAAPPAPVSGTLTATVTTAPIAGATVTLNPGGATTTTAADGSYQFTSVPVGEYVVSASTSDGRCAGQYATATVHVAGAPIDLDLSIAGGGDAWGYTCTVGSAAYIEANTTGHPGGDDVTWQAAPPFPITLYGLTYTSAWIDTNGAITFLDPSGSAYDASPIPSAAAPGRHNAAVYPLWDDWMVDGQSSIRTDTVGTAPNRKWVVEWRNVVNYHDSSARVDFEVIFEETGPMTFVYANIDPANPYERGLRATVGIEDATGTIAFQYLRAQTWLASGVSVTFAPNAVAGGAVSGTVTCLGSPLAGATVAVGSQSTTTAVDGTYALSGVPGGSYAVIATPSGGSCAGSRTAPATVGSGTHAVVNFDLTATPSGSAYTANEQPLTFVPAGTVLALTGDDNYTEVTLPFAVSLYGQSYSTAWVDTNGVVSLVDPGGSAWDTGAIPSAPASNRPNAALYPLWDDWMVDEQASVRMETIGTGPNRKLVIEWRDVRAWEDANARASFEVIFDEGGGFWFAYNDLNGGFFESGGGATIGIENAAGTVALQYSYNNPVARNGIGIRINPPTA